jgi:hypothetical protein
VGGVEERVPQDEQIRESLRRFIAGSSAALGVRPEELSLVSYADAPGGLKRAVYRQNAFPHPLRGGYGLIRVTFDAGLRVVGLSSTAVPDVERLRAALATAPPERLTAEKAVASLADAPSLTRTRPDKRRRVSSPRSPTPPRASWSSTPRRRRVKRRRSSFVWPGRWRRGAWAARPCSSTWTP